MDLHLFGHLSLCLFWSAEADTLGSGINFMFLLFFIPLLRVPHGPYCLRPIFFFFFFFCAPCFYNYGLNGLSPGENGSSSLPSLKESGARLSKISWNPIRNYWRFMFKPTCFLIQIFSLNFQTVQIFMHFGVLTSTQCAWCNVNIINLCP